MFDIEKWLEIFSAMRKNKLRTVLTGFSVAWGIFMLIVLLGFGQGLQNGIESEFKQDAINSIWIHPGETSKAYKGYQPGRRINFDLSDYEMIKTKIHDIEFISARYWSFGSRTIVYRKKTASYSINGAHPQTKEIESCSMLSGRFINDVDIDKFRKVAIIGEPVAKTFFDEYKEDPIGKFIVINKVPFLVVGVFTDPAPRECERIYIPITTSQKVFGGYEKINNIAVTANVSPERSAEMENQIKAYLAKKHHFDVDDSRAVYLWNTLKEYSNFQNLFTGIRVFVWVIGIFTLIAGIVGVSNIMMIVVKDRTKEIGIRKAIGATPKSVVGLIVLEAILITSLAGYIGLFLGVGLLDLISKALPPDAPFFANPEINVNAALVAIVVLIISGTFAGLIPATRAAAIKPIDALRDE